MSILSNLPWLDMLCFYSNCDLSDYNARYGYGGIDWRDIYRYSKKKKQKTTTPNPNRNPNQPAPSHITNSLPLLLTPKTHNPPTPIPPLPNPPPQIPHPRPLNPLPTPQTPTPLKKQTQLPLIRPHADNPAPKRLTQVQTLIKSRMHCVALHFRRVTGIRRVRCACAQAHFAGRSVYAGSGGAGVWDGSGCEGDVA